MSTNKKFWNSMNILEKAGVFALISVSIALITLTIAVIIDIAFCGN